MRGNTLRLIIILAFCACVGRGAAFAQQLLTNGSFESGDFSGWTTGGNFEFTQVVTGAFYVYSGAQDGNYYATMGPVSSDGTLSQTFATLAGVQYTVNFWFAAVGDSPSDFSVYWDNTQLLSLSDPNTGGTWTQYSFTGTGTGSDTLTFSFRDDPAYLALDNVSVGCNCCASGGALCGPTPEPSSWLLLATGIIGAAGITARKL